MSSTRRILGLEQRRKQQKMKKKEPKMIKDERFASAQSDPRFMEAPKRHSKVTIDSRFQCIFTDRSFISSLAPVDKQGRPKTNNASSSSLAHYYRLQQENENDPEKDAQVGQIGNPAESKSETGKLRNIEEEDDEDEDDDDDDGHSADDYSSTTSTTETRRLAVVNLDWTQVRGPDIIDNPYVIF